MGCYASGDIVIEEIPLCSLHHQRLLDRFAVRALAQSLTEVTAVVYYVAWKNRPDIVKIGTTTNLRLRLKGLSSTREPARVLVVEPGSYHLERKRHRQFSHLRVENEIYRWVPQMAEHVQALREVVNWTGGSLTATNLPTKLGLPRR